jgi:hypothetical protein
MNTRSYDLGVALAGIVFVIAGVLFLLEQLDGIELRPELVLPGVTIGLGAALVVSSLQRHRR